MCNIDPNCSKFDLLSYVSRKLEMDFLTDTQTEIAFLYETSKKMSI
jgi:hypothetical protein